MKKFNKIRFEIINGKVAIIRQRDTGRYGEIVLIWNGKGMRWGIIDTKANRLLDGGESLSDYILNGYCKSYWGL